MKVHLLDEGYAWVPKRKDFDEDPIEEIWGKSKFLGKIEVLGFRRGSRDLLPVRLCFKR